ncbi:aldehyde dehydrogenase family protein [Nocardioides sp. Soil796]|uniref:aldehyde dehydrogenase family protein n=1 Tax=Nocardioides sp. Soil796 TaxID=1736412 RepID=UPI00070D08D6|nr:aldehyde dehydrogenase family protein [Nocardioides sp. Soil796]KRF14392.1 aldehyde dehydrogenase [Nocardioides sp. Soil796]
MASRFRVTYATLSADNDDLHAAYEQGLETARSWFGSTLPTYVDGEARTSGELFDVPSPVDTSVVLCHVHAATTADVDDAVAAARAYGAEWARTPWRERVAILRRAGDLISERSNELAALMSMEVGKNRLEALGDVEESAVFFRYYSDMMEKHDGFDVAMDSIVDAESNRSVMRPYGVWGVISPFNFPMALAAGPTAGALIAGNTVVLKPSPQGTFSAIKLYECLRDAGLPAGAFHVVPGGDEIGKAVVAHPDVAGLSFTGSYEVGMSIYKQFATAFPKPVVCEMGGKNPTIVSRKADIELAAAGIARSAFGFSGQKCSACSRVYVERDAYEPLMAALAEKATGLALGNPTDRDVFLGPVIDEAAVARFTEAVDHARSNGRVVAGGDVVGKSPAGALGHYLAPTVVTDLPTDDKLFRDELFVPFVAVAPIDSIDEGLALANDTDLGLTAGFFSADDAEVQQFLDTIEAGVVYVNRAAGATTGAWPGVQPFGGWKGSGTAGKAGGGLYYVQQFLREQSRTVVS